MRAEYDFDNNWVTQVEGDNGQVTPTNNPSLPGARREWLDLETEYPEGYNPRFLHLLGTERAYRYDADENKVYMGFPEANFSVASVREALRFQVKSVAQRELHDTDWVVIRKAETGAPIPPEVLAERTRARQEADRMEREIDNLRDDELHDYVVTLGPKHTGHGEASPDSSFVAAVDENPEPKVPDGFVVEGGDGEEWRTDATSPDQEGKPVRKTTPAERKTAGRPQKGDK